MNTTITTNNSTLSIDKLVTYLIPEAKYSELRSIISNLINDINFELESTFFMV